MSNSEQTTGGRYSADAGLKMRDTRNGLYLDTQEQLEFATAMGALEGKAVDNEAHRAPSISTMSEDQLRREYNNMRNGNDTADVTTLTAPAIFQYPNPANVAP